MSDAPRAPRTGVVLAAVLALAFAAFLPSLPGDWIYDDHTLIAENPHAHSLSEWRWWVVNDFWRGNADAQQLHQSSIRYWRPWVSASYALDWTIGGGSTLMFHLTNLLAHVGVALLAFFVMRRWVNSLVPAALAAALFAIHPTKAESVAWIAGRTDVFCTLALLVATTGCAWRLARRRGGLALEIAGTVFAYLAKEQAIVLPIFILVEVWIAADRPALDRAFVRRAVRGIAPQVFVAVAYLVVRALVLPVRTHAAISPPPLDHILAVFESLGRYFALSLAPVQLTIQQALSYGGTGLAHVWPYVALGAVMTIGLALIAWRTRVIRPDVTLAIAVFGVTIAPTSNLAFTGMLTLISERYLYLPMIGIAWLAGIAAARWRAARIVLLAIVILFSALAARRSADYVSEEAFWGRELTIHPASREAHQYRVLVYVSEQRYGAALAQLAEFVRAGGADALELETITRIAEIDALLVPDLATQPLAEIDAFATALIEHRLANLTVGELSISIDPRAARIVDELAANGWRLWLLRASLASRRGDHAAAKQLMTHATAQCPACTAVVVGNALVLARAGDVDAGLAVLARDTDGGEPIVNARAMLTDAKTAVGTVEQLAALELWGAAYVAARPGTQLQPQRYAELAFRAGDADEARRVLEGQNADELFAQWSASMGWSR